MSQIPRDKIESTLPQKGFVLQNQATNIFITSAMGSELERTPTLPTVLATRHMETRF